MARQLVSGQFSSLMCDMTILASGRSEIQVPTGKIGRTMCWPMKQVLLALLAVSTVVRIA